MSQAHSGCAALWLLIRFQNREEAKQRRGNPNVHTKISCSKPSGTVHTRMHQSCSTGSLAVEVLLIRVKHCMSGGAFYGGQFCDVAVRETVMQCVATACRADVIHTSMQAIKRQCATFSCQPPAPLQCARAVKATGMTPQRHKASGPGRGAVWRWTGAEDAFNNAAGRGAASGGTAVANGHSGSVCAESGRV